MNPHRLYRCRHDRQLAGVAGGMAEYLDLDPTVVRILWILSVFLGGISILLYIILAFVVPLEPAVAPGPWSGWTPTWGTPPAGPAQPMPSGVTPEGTPVGPDGMPIVDGAVAPDGSTTPPPAWGQTPPAWGQAAPTWGWDAHAARPRREGRIGFSLGVLLIVFGGIALAEQLLPALAGHGLLAAGFLVAAGAALLVGSLRPHAAEYRQAADR